MKLIFKSDDYGFTKAVTDGTIDAIHNGLVRCAGLFVNMPAAAYAASRMTECSGVDFGLDVNIVAGKPVADAALLPDLVDQRGYFIRSTVKYADPRFHNDPELWPYDQVCLETAAQIERYRELTGKLPPYLNGHSISAASPVYCAAIRDTGEKYGVPYIVKELDLMQAVKMENWNRKPFASQDQMATDTEGFILEHLEKMKAEKLVLISGHAGYLDDELFGYTTYTLIRMKDHKAFTSARIKAWIEGHHAEVVSFSELIAEKKAG